jgi:hypothetical protein
MGGRVVMASLELAYTVFKAIKGSLRVYYIPSENFDTYYLYLFTLTAEAYHCTITDPNDINDFVINIQPTAIQVTSPAQAAVLNSNNTGARPVQLYTPNGIATSSTNDGRTISLPSLFPDTVQLYIAGAADDVINGRGQGSQFGLSSDVSGNSTLEFYFNDWVYIAGGSFRHSSASFGDSLTLEAKAPASSVTANLGNTGNCNLAASPFGANTLIVPASGNGAYDVNLNTAVPVPALNTSIPRAPIGYWNWSSPDTGKGTVSAGIPGGSPYNLFAITIDPLIRLVASLQLIGDSTINITVPAVNPKQFLPHWTMRAVLHNSGHTGLQVGFYLLLARIKTS